MLYESFLGSFSTFPLAAPRARSIMGGVLSGQISVKHGVSTSRVLGWCGVQRFQGRVLSGALSGVRSKQRGGWNWAANPTRKTAKQAKLEVLNKGTSRLYSMSLFAWV